jgi:hypothetical protein
MSCVMCEEEDMEAPYEEVESYINGVVYVLCWDIRLYHVIYLFLCNRIMCILYRGGGHGGALRRGERCDDINVVYVM